MSRADRGEGSAALREPWEEITRQRLASLAGIWLFSASEFLFFGGIFAGYAVYYYLWPQGFHEGSHETELKFGLSNTVVLLFSSAAAAVAAKAARWPALGGFSRAFVWIAACLGLAFLAIKGLEYHSDIEKNLFPGPLFAIPTEGAEVFFAFYWVATGLHALHLIIGIGLLARLAVTGARHPQWYVDTPSVTVTTLYWGFVDVIWTILFVLIYLPGRAS